MKGYEYQGCFLDSQSQREFSVRSSRDADALMSVGLCSQFCVTQGTVCKTGIKSLFQPQTWIVWKVTKLHNLPLKTKMLQISTPNLPRFQSSKSQYIWGVQDISLQTVGWFHNRKVIFHRSRCNFQSKNGLLDLEGTMILRQHFSGGNGNWYGEL